MLNFDSAYIFSYYNHQFCNSTNVSIPESIRMMPFSPVSDSILMNIHNLTRKRSSSTLIIDNASIFHPSEIKHIKLIKIWITACVLLLLEYRKCLYNLNHLPSCRCWSSCNSTWQCNVQYTRLSKNISENVLKEKLHAKLAARYYHYWRQKLNS